MRISDWSSDVCSSDLAARLAREACAAFTAEHPDRRCFVIGTLGPTSRTASISPKVEDAGFRNVSFDELAENYREAAQALIEGGADEIGRASCRERVCQYV